MPIECAHVWRDSGTPKGQKPNDTRCVSLCGGPDGHHAEQHRIGERAFEAKYRVDLVKLAAEFWQASPHRLKRERAA